MFFEVLSSYRNYPFTKIPGPKCFSPIVNCHFFISFYSICQFEERCSFHPANSYRLTRWRLHNTFSAIAPRSWLCSLLCFVFLPSQEWDQDSGDLVLWLNIHTCPKGNLLFCKKKKNVVLCQFAICNLNGRAWPMFVFSLTFGFNHFNFPK